MTKGAEFSPCMTYRYRLWRIWEAKPVCVFIGLNPSTADVETDDPTIRRCIRFARDWGYGGLMMLNAFAFRSTDPAPLRGTYQYIGPHNMKKLYAETKSAGIVVAAWGAFKVMRDRGPDIARAIIRQRGEIHALGFTRYCYPRHPLFVPASTTPVLWRLPQ